MELEKIWHTIKQVAEKWGCAEDDVLHQINIYNLNPSFFFENVKCYASKAPVNFDEDTPVTTHSGLVSLWLPSGEFCSKLLSMARESTCDLTECFFVPGPFRHTDKDFKVLRPIESKHLPIIISDVELRRFESQYSKLATEPPAGIENKKMSPDDIWEFIEQNRADNISDKTIFEKLLMAKNNKGNALSKTAIASYFHKNPDTVADRSTFTHLATTILKS